MPSVSPPADPVRAWAAHASATAPLFFVDAFEFGNEGIDEYTLWIDGHPEWTTTSAAKVRQYVQEELRVDAGPGFDIGQYRGERAAEKWARNAASPSGMRLLVLGAAGPTGRHVVAQAVDQGHAVTAFVRPSHAVPSEPPVTVVTGDATNPDDLGRALPGHDAVISTLGRGLRLRSEGLMERAARALVLAMERLGPKRLIFLSAFGVGDSARGAPLLPRLMFRLILRDIYADKALADDLVRRSALDWTLIHPTQLTNGPRTGRYHFGDSLRLRGVPRISRADTAGFLLSCLTDPSTVRRSLFVSY